MIKFDLDDPKLTSFVLDELKGFDRDNVQEFLASDIAAQNLVESTRKSLGILRHASTPVAPVDLTDAEKENLIQYWKGQRVRGGFWTGPRIVSVIFVIGVFLIFALMFPDLFSKKTKTIVVSAPTKNTLGAKASTSTPKSTSFAKDAEVEKKISESLDALPAGHWIVLLDQGLSMRKSLRLSGFVEALQNKIATASPEQFFSLISFDSTHVGIRFEHLTRDQRELSESLNALGDGDGMSLGNGLTEAIAKTFEITHRHQTENSAMIVVTDHPLGLAADDWNATVQQLKSDSAPHVYILGFGEPLLHSAQTSEIVSVGRGRIFPVD